MRRPATVLAGQTSLGVLAALIESSTLVVCNDTGISHLADALATRSVVLLTGSDPNRWAPRDPTLHHALTYPLTLDPACVLAHGLALFDAEPACVS
jgi:ADP-heptose:LPS heptosyltransferase